MLRVTKGGHTCPPQGKHSMYRKHRPLLEGSSDAVVVFDTPIHTHVKNITHTQCLGHNVSDSRISIDPERIAAILNLPAPTSKKEVQDFIGVIKFICRFVPDFVVMVKPIHNLLKQDRSFAWTYDVENAFVGIKKEINSTPVLAKPDFEKEFTIYTNSIEEVVSAILMQNDDQGNEKPMAYMSQSLSNDEFKYSFIENMLSLLLKLLKSFTTSS
jgi:hypothetical protein